MYREFLSDYGVKSFDAVRHHQTDPLNTTFFQPVKDITPARGAFLRHVEDAKNLACAFFGYGQCHIERLGSHRSLAVYLDVHAVNEHDWVIFFETAFKPFIDLSANTFHHTADARLGVVPAVYLVEYVTNLFLSKPLCIKDSGEPIAFLFLVAEYGEYLRMEVAVAVSRDTELKFSPWP